MGVDRTTLFGAMEEHAAILIPPAVVQIVENPIASALNLPPKERNHRREFL